MNWFHIILELTLLFWFWCRGAVFLIVIHLYFICIKLSESSGCVAANTALNPPAQAEWAAANPAQAFVFYLNRSSFLRRRSVESSFFIPAHWLKLVMWESSYCLLIKTHI